MPQAHQGTATDSVRTKCTGVSPFHRRALFVPHMKQIHFPQVVHRGFFVKKSETSRRVQHHPQPLGSLPRCRPGGQLFQRCHHALRTSRYSALYLLLALVSSIKGLELLTLLMVSLGSS